MNKKHSHGQIRRPFLKWAGGKTKLVPAILKELPQANTLIEPFVGSGALFLNSQFRRYRLYDVNPDLIHIYRWTKEDGPNFIKEAQKLFAPENNHPEIYYQFRKRFNECQEPYERSLLFLYLNRHGYNGLCRYNRSGQFNVPFGRYVKPYFPEAELQYFHEKAASASFQCLPFQKSMTRIKGDSVIYCDPPYIPLTSTASFTNYHLGDFHQSDQVTLSELARQLAKTGTPVLLSNHDTVQTRKLYQGAKFTSLLVKRYISCKGQQRQPVKELLALFR